MAGAGCRRERTNSQSVTRWYATTPALMTATASRDHDGGLRRLGAVWCVDLVAGLGRVRLRRTKTLGEADQRHPDPSSAWSTIAGTAA